MKRLLKAYFGFIKKMIPEKPQGVSVGLDISENECGLIELFKDENGEITLTNWAIEPVVTGNLKDAVSSIIEKMSDKRQDICTTVYGKGTLIRYVDLPRMSPSDLKNSFSLEADKYFPFPQDQIYTDCYVMNPDEKTPKMSVMAVAARKEVVDHKINILSDLGLKTGFVSTNSVVLMNLLQSLGLPKGVDEKSAVAFLDIEDTVSSLSILVNGNPKFTRDIFIGSNDFINKVSNSLGIDAQKAAETLVSGKENQQKILSACETAIANILQELRLSFDYFSTEKNVDITSIIITGSGKYYKSIYKMISDALDLKVVDWDPLSFLTIGADVDEKEIKKYSSKLGVAMGLALYDDY